MAKTDIAVAELIWNLIAGNVGNVGRVKFLPQKPAFPHPGEESDGPETLLERATPESQGISSLHLAGFLKELSRLKGTDIHQVLVARNGKVICECGFAPWPAGLWHASYSLCKSITGMAVGMLVEEGRLELHTRVPDLFRKRRLRNVLRQKDITVENLLTMTSCVNFTESGIISGDDWVKGFLEAGLTGVPGRDFQYNSMNTYMLSAIVTELTGETLMEYLRPRLWEPLGIRRVFWETCPMGITKGGWGLFLRPEDAAKLGILYLQKGRWNDRQLVDETWVEASCSPHSTPPPEMGNHGYGYQIWMAGKEGSFNFNGMLGQNVVAWPDTGLVVVTNAGSVELFQNCALMGLVKKYFETDFHPADMLPEDEAGLMTLRRLIDELGGRRTGLSPIESGGWMRRRMPPGRENGVRNTGSGRKDGAARREILRQNRIHALDGKCYEMQEPWVGLMPLLMQVLHNNYTDGIRRIGFAARGRRLFIGLQEGGGTSWMEVGFNRAVETDVSFRGEIYRLGVKGEFSSDEDGRPVLKLDFAFLEEACRRKLKLYFEEEELRAAWDETPGKEVIMTGLDLFTDTEGKMGLLMEAIRESGGIDVFHILAQRTVQPVCTGRLLEGKACREEGN